MKVFAWEEVALFLMRSARGAKSYEIRPRFLGTVIVAGTLSEVIEVGRGR
jgi:hypothetical protein